MTSSNVIKFLLPFLSKDTLTERLQSNSRLERIHSKINNSLRCLFILKRKKIYHYIVWRELIMYFIFSFPFLL